MLCGNYFHKKNLEIFLVIPPELIRLFRFKLLEKYFDGFLVMTYDWSLRQNKPGPNAPIDVFSYQRN